LRPYDRLHHARGVRLELALVEGRLQQPPLPPPRLAFIDQQATPEHPRQQAAGAILAKALRLLHQDFFDARLLRDEVEVQRQAGPHDRTVAPMDVGHPSQDVGPEQAPEVPEVPPGRPNRRQRPARRRRGRRGPVD
jgi:hypothetical protein